MRLVLFIFLFALFASVVGDMRHTQERLRTYSRYEPVYLTGCQDIGVDESLIVCN